MYEGEQRIFDEKNEKMPWFVQEFFAEKSNLSIFTKLAYVDDIEQIFSWLYENRIVNKMPSQVTIDDLNTLTINHYRYFFDHLRLKGNGEYAINRKIGSLRSFFTYLNLCEDERGYPLLKRNFLARFSCKMTTPKMIASNIHDKILTNLDERRNFINFICNEYRPQHKLAQQYFLKNKERDAAIICLFLYSGIKLTELLSLNVSDVDIENRTLSLTRKMTRGKYYSVKITFGIKARRFLKEYLKVRELRYNVVDSENGLFISNRGTTSAVCRIKKRTLEYTIERYTNAFGRPEINAKRLRQSFGAIQYVEEDREELGNQMGITINSTEVYRLLSANRD